MLTFTSSDQITRAGRRTSLLWQMDNIFHFRAMERSYGDVMMGIKFQCKITSQELWNERLQRESDLTFRTDILYVIPTSERHFHSCSNETFDIQVRFEARVSVIQCRTIQNVIKQERV